MTGKPIIPFRRFCIYFSRIPGSKVIPSQISVIRSSRSRLLYRSCTLIQRTFGYFQTGRRPIRIIRWWRKAIASHDSCLNQSLLSPSHNASPAPRYPSQDHSKIVSRPYLHLATPANLEPYLSKVGSHLNTSPSSNKPLPSPRGCPSL